MASAKDIVLRAISAADANALVKRVHYSGKVANNSQLHIGVFLAGRLEGAMQFGPSLDKRKLRGLVEGTPWNGFIELNRMAFTDRLPRNSESRALGVALRMMRKHAPYVQWVVTFADGAQCGDGTIYRAAGFVLTSIKRNNQIWSFLGGSVATRMSTTDTRRPQRGRLLDEVAQARFSRMSLTAQGNKGGAQQKKMASTFSRATMTKGSHIHETGAASMRPFIEAGATPLPGFQLRYLAFLDPTARERLTVPILPYDEIERRGAGMYRGKPRAGSIGSDATPTPGRKGGATPTPALSTCNQVSERAK